MNLGHGHYYWYLNRESIKHYVPPDGSTYNQSISFKQTHKWQTNKKPNIW